MDVSELHAQLCSMEREMRRSAQQEEVGLWEQLSKKNPLCYFTPLAVVSHRYEAEARFKDEGREVIRTWLENKLGRRPTPEDLTNIATELRTIGPILRRPS